MGIIPIARIFGSPDDGSFISGVWIRNNGQYVFVPKPGRLLARLWWAMRPPGKKNLDAHIRGVAQGLLPTCGGLPVIGPFIAKFNTPGDTLVGREHYVYQGVCVEWGAGVWQEVADRYHVSVLSLRMCDAWIRQLPAGPYLLKHPVLDAMMEVDLAGLMDRPVSHAV
jgi:hypothetical protein